jgi:cation transport regulator ChaB
MYRSSSEVKKMPYPDNASLPERVRKLPPKKQRQWRHVFNGAFKRCKASGKSTEECERFAFRNAWGVGKRQGSNMEDCDCEKYSVMEHLMDTLAEHNIKREDQRIRIKYTLE